ncbi:MAG TPA: DUF4118 domain-containing protein, partial [Thermomicrobiales bacterium]|nr:DUF4118 domain-containing protein [Thermomicrobiales bacterium]
MIAGFRTVRAMPLARRPLATWQRHAIALLVVTAATAVMLTVRSALGVLNVVELYLIVFFLLTVTVGPGPGAFAAAVAVLSFDFFFIPPYYTFTPVRGDHVLVMVAFLVVAFVTGKLVDRSRAEAEAAQREQRRSAQLVTFTGALLGKVTQEATLAAIAEQIVGIAGAAMCRIYLNDDGNGLVERACFPPALCPEPDQRSAAPGPTGAAGRRGSPPQPPNDVRSIPIMAGDRLAGMLEITAPAAIDVTQEGERLLHGLANQTALALERARLAEVAAQAAALAESDELKSALLSAVSHDLRTPLATIMTAATALLDRSVDWQEEDGLAFLQTINDEAARLAR